MRRKKKSAEIACPRLILFVKFKRLRSVPGFFLPMSLLPALLPMAGGAHGRHLSPLLEDTWLMAAAILAMVLLVFVMCILGCTRLQRAPMFPSPFAPLDETEQPPVASSGTSTI